MLDIDKCQEILENYFANVTQEKFAIDLEKYCPELVESVSDNLSPEISKNAEQPDDRDNDRKIIDSWYKNAAPWIVAIEERQIESRNLVTDRSIVDAVVSRGGHTVLDLGCGEGWLTRALIAQGMNVLGADIIPALIDRSRLMGLGQFELASYADIAAGKLAKKFDIVVANFSLIGQESVENLFRSMRSLLNPGGAFIIQTLHPTISNGDLPYRDGWRASTWNGFSDDFTDPAPWYFRTLATWIELYTTNGLSIVEIREPIHPHTSKPAAVILMGILRG